MYFQETPPYGQYTYDVLVGKFITLSNQFKDVFVLSEWHIYGSSRLGIQKPKLVTLSQSEESAPNGTAGGRELVHVEFNGSWSSYEVNYADTSNTTITTYQMSYEYYSLTRGEKNYELTNHLGNVLVVISDKKLKTCEGDTVNYYIADVVQANDYYAFGSPMPGRQFNAGNYRFGFNGKEADDEVVGDGNSYDYGARIYNPRLGRWLSVDPLQSEYPSLSTYNYCANNPIYFIDPDGKKILIHYIDENGKSQAYEYGSKQAVPDNKFVQETVNALNYVSQSKTGKREVDVAVNSNRTLNIHQITDEGEMQQGPNILIVIPTEEGAKDPIVKDNNGNPITPDVLSWSPYSKSEVVTDEGEGTGNTQSAALMLVHEIKHWNGAVKSLWGSIRRLLTKDAKYENREERKAVKTETKIANELGENTRNNHKGKIHKSSGSTDKAPVTPSKKTKRGGM